MRHVLLSFVPLLLVSFACDQPRVGNPCHIDGDPDAQQSVLASPSLECEARQCLRIKGQDVALCTAACDTDGDCEAMPDSPCVAGFVCVAPFVTGEAACRKMCACADDVDRVPGAEASCP